MWGLVTPTQKGQISLSCWSSRHIFRPFNMFWGFSLSVSSVHKIPGARLPELLNIYGDFWYVWVHNSYITCLVSALWLVEFSESSSIFLNICRLLYYTNFVCLLTILMVKHCLEFYRYLAAYIHIYRQGYNIKSGLRTTDWSAFPNQLL